MKNILYFICFFLLNCTNQPEVVGVNKINNTDFIKCLDVSYLPEIELNDGRFFFKNQEVDFFKIAKSSGINAVRIRIWNNHINGESSLSNAVELGLRAKALGLKVILDFHYSDTWADPGNQSKPMAWKNKTFSQLKKIIEDYTYNSILFCIEKNMYPDFVQTGNEISGGMLWDEGKIGGDFNYNWSRFSELLSAALEGVKKADILHTIKTIVHHHDGSNYNNLKWFFSNLYNQSVEFDIIGVSYYPFFSKDNIEKFTKSISRIGIEFDKPVFLAETAYPWTTDWNDSTGNVFGEANYVLPGYPATKEGQNAYVFAILEAMQNSGVIGVAYWGGEWISIKTHGSMWENLALFDFEGNILPALSNGW